MGLAAFAGASCRGGDDIARDDERIVSGQRDLAVAGEFDDDVRQWHRDATVDLGFCTGTLVSPRIVLTAAHCFAAGRGQPATVSFSPTSSAPASPPPDGPAPYRTPPSTPVPVIACLTMAASGVVQCGSAAAFQENQRNNDIAVLVLDRRIDVGESGLRSSPYPAIPATVIQTDPGCPGSPGGAPDAICWDAQSVFHVGYGPVSGCESPNFGLQPHPRPLIRQIVHETVAVGSLGGLDGEGAIMTLQNLQSLPGDSGGPVFSDYGGGYDDTHPLGLIGVTHGYESGIGNTPVCLPGDTGASEDIVVRVTSGDIVTFLTTILGPSYAGTMVNTSASRWTRTGTFPPIWTGPSDVPPRSEVAQRAAVTNADALDPDGDGLVGAHDNCFGVNNPQQQTNVTGTPFFCYQTSGTAVQYGCAATDIDPDPDRDGVPAVCDSCPTLANIGRDRDSNGVDDACQTNSDTDELPDTIDNCPTVANPLQTNCNADAETVLGAPVRGDACDPNPCPSGRSGVLASSSDIVSASFGGTGIGANVTGQLRGVGTATAGFRWCPCNLAGASDTPAWRNTCRLTRGCTVSSAAYALGTGNSWRAMTNSFSTHTPNASGEISLHMGATTALPGERTDNYLGTWAMVSDATAAGALISTNIGPVLHRETSAVLWSTARGWAAGPLDGSCTSGAPSGCTVLPADLAGHYWSGRFVDDSSNGTFVPDRSRALWLRNLFTPDMCPTCAASFPNMFLAFGGQCTTPPCDLIGRFSDPQGNAHDLSLTPQLAAGTLADDLLGKQYTWSAAQESNDTLDVNAVRAIATATDASGHIWLQRVIRSPLAKMNGIPAGLGSAPLAEIDRYVGAVPLVDGSDGRVYYLGGTRSTTMGDPWIFAIDLNTGEQRQTALRRQWQGNVVAAALDPSGGYAMVLESNTFKFNIVRLNLATGEATVTATYKNRGLSASHTVAALPDGRFVFASSPTASRATAMVTTSWGTKGLVVEHKAQVSFSLLSASSLSTSLDGITIAGTPGKAEDWRPVGVRYSSFTSAVDIDLANLF